MRSVITFPLISVVALSLLVTACSSSKRSPAATSTQGGSSTTAGTASSTASSPVTAESAVTSVPATGSGPVNVLYAGSLVDLMTKQIGPAFDTASGYKFTGFSAGSSALATQIKGKIRAGDVFVSASPTVNATLQGAANGNWVSWYATFATAPLVIGYNPKSKFAADLTSKPWYDVVTEPGFRLGSTDPATDPKGKLAATALTTAKATTPALKSVKPAIYPEETLVGRLQAGQLDAAFFYAPEALAAGIKTVDVTGQKLKASYTVTVLNKAPDQGAEAFVAYLLGSNGLAALKKDGFTIKNPVTVTGTGVPASLKSVLAG